jgi:hypothetical protein
MEIVMRFMFAEDVQRQTPSASGDFRFTLDRGRLSGRMPLGCVD